MEGREQHAEQNHPDKAGIKLETLPTDRKVVPPLRVPDKCKFPEHRL